MNQQFDVVVAGGGIAGLTAAMTAARLGRATLVVIGDVLGGHLLSIEKREGYPGFPDGVAGSELCPPAHGQAAEAGCEFEMDELPGIAPDGDAYLTDFGLRPVLFRVAGDSEDPGELEEWLDLSATSIPIQGGPAGAFNLNGIVASEDGRYLLVVHTGEQRLYRIDRESQEVVPAARALADEIAGCAPLANRAVKRALDRSLDATLEDQLSFEASEQAINFGGEDVPEGIAAVRERRDPKFTGP